MWDLTKFELFEISFKLKFEAVFFVTLFTFGLFIIFDKYNLKKKFQSLGFCHKTWFFYELSNCLFCVQFWTACFVSFFWCVFNCFSIDYIFVPFLSVSLLHLIKSIK